MCYHCNFRSPDIVVDQTSEVSIVIDDVLVQLEIPPFSPVSAKWQEDKCDLLALDMFAANTYTTKGTPLRHSKPIDYIEIAGRDVL